MTELFNALHIYILDQFNNNDFFAGAFLTGVVIAAISAMKRLGAIVYKWIVARYVVSINIDSMDSSFIYFQKWLNKNDFSKTFRNFSVVSLYKKNDQLDVVDTTKSNKEQLLLAPYS